MADYTINIVHLFPDLLNLYGDRGNIQALSKRLLWRGIDVNLKTVVSEDEIDIKDADIIVLGGGGDREMELVCQRLMPKREELCAFVEQGGTLLATCGGFEMLGTEFQIKDKKVKGLGILEISSENLPDSSRITGNIAIKCQGIDDTVVGFENHSGKMNIGEYEPLGKVISGFGNDKTSGFEGLVYKNVTATYMHGPLLPKNPLLCDKILLNALKHKYSDFDALSPIDNGMEILANDYMVKRMGC